MRDVGSAGSTCVHAGKGPVACVDRATLRAWYEQTPCSRTWPQEALCRCTPLAALYCSIPPMLRRVVASARGSGRSLRAPPRGRPRAHACAQNGAQWHPLRSRSCAISCLNLYACKCLCYSVLSPSWRVSCRQAHVCNASMPSLQGAPEGGRVGHMSRCVTSLDALRDQPAMI